MFCNAQKACRFWHPPRFVRLTLPNPSPPNRNVCQLPPLLNLHRVPARQLPAPVRAEKVRPVPCGHLRGRAGAHLLQGLPSRHLQPLLRGGVVVVVRVSGPRAGGEAGVTGRRVFLGFEALETVGMASTTCFALASGPPPTVPALPLLHARRSSPPQTPSPPRPSPPGNAPRAGPRPAPAAAPAPPAAPGTSRTAPAAPPATPARRARTAPRPAARSASPARAATSRTAPPRASASPAPWASSTRPPARRAA